MDFHKIVVHKISIILEAKSETEDLPNGKIKVTTMQTDKDIKIKKRPLKITKNTNYLNVANANRLKN